MHEPWLIYVDLILPRDSMLPNNKYTGTIEGFHMHEFLKSRYR